MCTIYKVNEIYQGSVGKKQVETDQVKYMSLGIKFKSSKLKKTQKVFFLLDLFFSWTNPVLISMLLVNFTPNSCANFCL